MKLTKIAGAFALTAAMAMAAVPAFADVVDATNEGLFSDSATNKATAQTKVYATPTNVDLSATIPTQVAVVIPGKGTGTITAPSATAYKIVNQSKGQIYLQYVAGTEGMFKLTNNADAQPTSGQIMNMKLQAGSTATKDITTSDVAINAPIGVNSELGLQLSGNVAIQSGVTLTTTNLTSSIVTLTYTIGTASL